MNTTGPNDLPPTDATRREAEWQAQEQAMRDERAGIPHSAGDVRRAEYRLISRALRHPPLDPVPFDFARSVAKRATAVADADDRVEQLLLRGLVGAMVIAGAVIAAIYGAAWWPAVAGVLPLPAGELLRWGLVLVACAGTTWMLGQVLRSEDTVHA
jgi:hypothetical protein